MRETLESYCRRMKLEFLLKQWDDQRNFPLSPSDITYGSKKKVWWRCEKGHQWQTAVYTRTGAGTGCPVCAGKVPCAGETDLAARYPEVARQWHPALNGLLSPEQVLPGSHRMIWWQCEKGHIWRAQVKSRVSGCGCPVCANREVHAKENDLATKYPQLLSQWHPVKNHMLTPDAVTPGSSRKVWWRCEKGHEWQATIVSRTSGGTGCPVCSGKKVLPGENDLASEFPKIAEQWHPTRNGALTPDQVTPYSNRKVWWRCDLNHDYLAAVSARTMYGSDCPYCSGRKVLPGFNDLATKEPALAEQWHPTLNGALTPEMVTAGSCRKVWWKCDQGHTWRAVIHSRTGSKRCGCPICSGCVKLEKY